MSGFKKFVKETPDEAVKLFAKLAERLQSVYTECQFIQWQDDDDLGVEQLLKIAGITYRNEKSYPDKDELCRIELPNGKLLACGFSDDEEMHEGWTLGPMTTSGEGKIEEYYTLEEAIAKYPEYKERLIAGWEEYDKNGAR